MPVFPFSHIPHFFSPTSSTSQFARNRTQNNAFGYDPYSSNQRQGNNQYGAIRGYGSHGSFNRMPYPAQGQNSFGASPAANNGIVLFVYHVPMECSEEQLFQLFSLYGPVTRVNIVRDKNTGIMKGFAFVTMVNYPEAVNVSNFFFFSSVFFSFSFFPFFSFVLSVSCDLNRLSFALVSRTHHFVHRFSMRFNY